MLAADVWLRSAKRSGGTMKILLIVVAIIAVAVFVFFMGGQPPLKRRDQLLSAWSVRGVPLQGGGMETSGRQPCHFLHRRAEIAILKKCDVFIDKPAVFVYLHLRVGM